jgi:hypothetical protein
MAKAKSNGGAGAGQSKVLLNHNTLKSTSIGNGPHCKPKNKHKRRNWKQYRGQGK